MTKATACSVEGCIREVYAKKLGLCSMHYQRRKRGKALGGVEPMYERGAWQHKMAGKPICTVHDCSQPRVARGLCPKHYRRLNLYDSTDDRFGPGAEGVAFLESLTEPTGECVIWPFARSSKDGRGVINALGETTAHRVCARIHLEPEPEDKPWVLHSCGLGHEGCVAPWHLYWGDRADNTFDRDVTHNTHVRGIRSPHAKLDDDKVRVIRTSGRSLTSLAAEYGVSKQTIKAVRDRRSWKHVA